ncbi:MULTISPECIES: helix-turn-helix domain-containing protein [unclassified Thioalkalivibrio]|uniref:helix-turn-helix domain-containing protein n=1 Tax=unclassified Thioalkalivibrio TaxID=2621013 RepID=UPI00037313E4|nr:MULTISPECIES: helix-turn-helix transcriptional regulator [unclassified Thioalkalivibrio]
MGTEITPLREIIRARISLGLEEIGRKQRWLAGQVGVSPSAVTGWVQEGQITIDNLELVAEALGKPLQWFLGASSGAEPVEHIPIYGSTEAIESKPTRYLPAGGPAGPEYWALEVAGTHWDPRYRDGEMLLLDRIRPPAPGVDVLLHSQATGEVRVEALVAVRPKAVCLAPVCGGSRRWEDRELDWAIYSIAGVHSAFAL